MSTPGHYDMLSFYYIYAVVGIIAGIIGIGTLWFSWVNKKKSLPIIVCGWLIIILSLILWGYAGGTDRGVAMGLMMLGVIALCFIFLPSLKQKTIFRVNTRRSTKGIQKEKGGNFSNVLKNPLSSNSAINSFLYFGSFNHIRK